MTHRTCAVRIALVLAALCSIWGTVRSATAAPPTFGMHAPITSTVGDDAVYAGDVTVPDHTIYAPGQRFIKTWRIRNIGTSRWTAAYHWRFEAGTQLSPLLEVPSPLADPGMTVLISVPMVAPLAGGVYTSFWQMTNAAGGIFGHQAWVSIVVRGAAPRSPTPTPTAAPTESATATPTATSSATPIRPPPPPPAPPTIALPGGNGVTVGSPWVGALVYRTFFPAGSTLRGMQETIALYYPGAGVAHVRLTLYRPDGAQRTLLLALRHAQRTTLSLNRIAPNTDIAAAVEADRRVLAGRTVFAARTLLADPGAARTARTWFFPAVASSQGTDQRLVFFNPHDVPSTVTVRSGLARGGCCARTTTLSVPPLTQYIYHLGTGASSTGPLSISAESVVAAERILSAPDGTLETAVPGSVIAARRWYLPGVSTAAGTSVTLFNPQSAPVTVGVRAALDEGPSTWIRQTVGAFSQLSIPVAGLNSGSGVGVEVTAGAPIVAGASWTDRQAQQWFSLAGTVVTPDWAVLGSAAGRGSSQTLTVLNPNDAAVTVTVGTGRDGAGGPGWQVSMPPHSRYARVLDGLVPADGGIVVIHASAPVAVGRTLAAGNTIAATLGAVVGR